MSEMLEIVSELILLLGLFYFAWRDYKTKLIPVVPILGLGIMGVVLNLLTGLLAHEDAVMQLNWHANILWKMFSGTLVGIVLLMISLLTAESVGLGDGLLFITTGLFLDLKLNAVLFFYTLLFAGIVSFGCLLLKRKGKYDRVAMGPFMLVAYVTFIL